MVSVSRSALSDSLRPHGLQPARFCCPWDSSGKHTGVGSHSLLQGIFSTQRLNPGLLRCRQILYHLSHPRVLVLFTQSHPTLCDPMDCSLLCPWNSPGQVHWSELPFPSPWDFPNPGVEPGSPALQEGSLPHEPPEKPSIFICPSPHPTYVPCG